MEADHAAARSAARDELLKNEEMNLNARNGSDAATRRRPGAVPVLPIDAVQDAAEAAWSKPVREGAHRAAPEPLTNAGDGMAMDRELQAPV